MDNEVKGGVTLPADYMTFPRQFSSYRWFHPILVGVLFFFFYTIVSIIVYVACGEIFGAENLDKVLGGGYESMNFFDNPRAVVSLFVIAVMSPCLALSSYIVRDRPFSSYFSSRGNGWNWGLFLKCLLVALLVCGLEFVCSLALLFFSDAENIEIRANFLGLFLILVFVPFQCVAEEYVFRGFISQTIASWVRLPVVGVIVPSFVFAALHPYNLTGVVAIFLCGVIFALLAWRTNGLEASSALHIVSNIQAFLLTSVHFAGEKTSGISSEVSVFSACVDVTVMVVYLICVFVIMHKKPEWFKGTVA